MASLHRVHRGRAGRAGPHSYEGVSDETWAQVRKHYDDDQIIALASLIAMINATNRLGVILNNQGGAYEPGNFPTIAS